MFSDEINYSRINNTPDKLSIHIIKYLGGHKLLYHSYIAAYITTSVTKNMKNINN